MEDMEAVYRQHAQTVYKFLLSQCRDGDLAEELTQETFYQAMRSVGRYDGGCKISVWLCQIAKHLWYQRLRKQKNAPLSLEEAEEPLVPSAEDCALARQDQLELLRQIAGKYMVSIGHSEADYDTAMAGFAAGATHATHLYNGMPSFLHRAPGVIGAAFDAGANVELICDGLHIHPAVIRATYRLFGEKLNLISDSLRCAGMPDGSYELGGQPIVMKDHKATLLDGTIAGSSISLLDALRNVVRFGLPLEAAVYAASTAPAEAAGLGNIGSLELGKAADFVVLDQDLALKAVFVDGERVV